MNKHRPSIIARIKGGLGNQLFCYAAARRLAITNDCELVIDHISGFKRDFQFKREYALGQFNIPCRKASPTERFEPFERYQRGFHKLLAKVRPFEKRDYIEQEFIEFDERLLKVKPTKNIYLDGLWQSENYFKDVESVIRTELKITEPLDIKNQQMATKIRNSNAVSLHVRWFNTDLSNPSHNLSVDYYKNAIEKIKNLVDSPHFFLFSDNPAAAKKMLGLGGETITLVSHNQNDEMAYADLWLMSQCKFFITANSTFSWWGAWLSNYKDKVVFTPSIELKGLTAWGFEGLIPDSWILI